MNDSTIQNQETFDRLLSWLSPDRDVAGQKYEEIRRALILMLTWRGISDAETLADETINVVAKKLSEIAPHYIGDRRLYFYSVAKTLAKAYERQQQLQISLETLDVPSPRVDNMDPSEEELEKASDCLDNCLKRLPKEKRRLVLEYYAGEKQAKIDRRSHLAREMHIDSNALRVRVYRIRAQLQSCIEYCLEQKGEL